MLRVAGTTSRLAAALVFVAVLIAGGILSGCGGDPEDVTSVSEGEPMKLGDLVYNVQISRFLNPADDEDSAYLAGKGQPPRDDVYLGVFMTVENEGDTAQTIPKDFKIVDTTGAEYKAIPTNSDFALRLGTTVPPDRTLPNAESTAASGPIQGSMVLFQITHQGIENRPLILDIPSSTGSTGEVTLDI